MPIVLNSLLKSTVANATFLDKTIDDITVGVLGLNETLVGNSGDEVIDTQLAINTTRKIVTAEVVKNNGDTITLDPISLLQESRLSGNGGGVVLNILPFGGSKVVDDGCEIILVGHDDTNTVTLAFNDVNFGLKINGSATLLEGYILTLIYNDEKQRYYEKSRNF